VERVKCAGCHGFDPALAPARLTATLQPRLCQACVRGGKAICKRCGIVYERASSRSSFCRGCAGLPERSVWDRVPAPIGGPVIVEARSHRPFAVEIEAFRYLSRSTAPRGTLDHWEEATDASIHPDGEEGEAEAVEWRSPPFIGDAGLEVLRRDVRRLREMGFETNQSTGLHVHASIAETAPTDRLALLKFGRWIEGDIFGLVEPARRNCSFCRPLAARPTQNRYLWLNVEPAFHRHNTAEIRLHQGTTDPDLVVEWVKVCLAVVERGLRLGAMAAKPPGSLFDLLDLTEYQRRFWAEAKERLDMRRG
jgi:hypothetical protein